MVGTLVRLQLKLSWRQMKSSTGLLVGNLIMLLLTLGSVIPLMWGLTSLQGTDLTTRATITALGFAALTLGWPVMVTLFTGSNDLLDAGRFALYPLRPRRLLPGLLVAAATGLGGLLTVLLGLGYVVAWGAAPGTLLAAVVGLVLGFATCLVSSRALASLLAGLLRRRRARDLVMVVLFLGIMGVSLAVQMLSARMGNGLDEPGGVTIDFAQGVARLEPAAHIAAWTPFGWAWALPWAVAQGSYGTAALWLVLAVAWLAGLAWVWMHQFAQGLVSPLEAGGRAEKIAKANPLDALLPDTPAGAVAKRGLRYWRRDPRRLIGAIATLLLPFIFGLSIMATGGLNDPEAADVLKKILCYIPAFIGFMAATSVGWDISYDGSALATQIITGVSGRADRWGRVLAYLVVFVPVQVVFIIGFVAYAGHWELLASVVGLCAAALLVGAGVGSWLGSLWQIPQAPAGSNLFNKNGSGGVAGFLGAMVGLALPVLICLPTVVLAVLAATEGGPFGWLTLLAGAITGALTLWWGVASGGKRLDRTWPEVLAKVTWKG